MQSDHEEQGSKNIALVQFHKPATVEGTDKEVAQQRKPSSLDLDHILVVGVPFGAEGHS